MLKDSGATYSFASQVFIGKIKEVPHITNRPFDIMVPYDEVLNSTQLVKACEVVTSGHKLCVDLIIL